METHSEISGLPMSKQQQDRIYEAMLEPEVPTEKIAFLMYFLKILETNGLKPPAIEAIVDMCGYSLGELDIPTIQAHSKELFTILAHPVFSDMLSAARADKQSQYQHQYKVGGNENEATIQAWKEPYIGRAAQVLRATVDRMNSKRGTANYANYLPIVQSSGMGKSRAVDELAQQVFTLPFCLRPDGDKEGYPKADIGIFDTLVGDTTINGVRSRQRMFFEKLFTTVYEELKNWPTYPSQEKLASAFHEWLDENRAKLYEEVRKQTVREILDRKTRPKLKPEVSGGDPRHFSKPSTGDTDPTLPLERAGVSEPQGGDQLCWVATNPQKSDSEKSSEWTVAKALVDLIQQKSGVAQDNRVEPRSPGNSGLGQRVWLCVYFDESHTLTNKDIEPENQETQTAYQILCWAINRFRALDLFFVFLSTNSSISVYSPPTELFWSNRVKNETTPGVQVPFCELVFDEWGGDKYLLRESQHTIESVCEPKFMIRFGRPLFWTRYKGGDSEVRENILSFARGKLSGSSIDLLNEDGKLAVAGVRLGLSFDRARIEARLAEGRLVRGHMRVAWSIPEHRQFIYAGAPSEPILAEAAAQLMHTNHTWEELPDVLFAWCNNGLILKGERGELLARLLLTKAHDQVISPRWTELQSPPVFTRPILLADFLAALLGEANKDMVMKAKPDNVASGVALSDSLLGKATLNFTHWAKAGDKSVVTDDAAWIALGRCLAWQCCDGQPEVDLITPLMLPLKDAKLGRYTVSAILWQIKNRSAPTRVDISAERLGFFSHCSPEQAPSSLISSEVVNSRPYLTIVLNLGVSVAKSRTGGAKADSGITDDEAKPVPDGTRAKPNVSISPDKRISSRNSSRKSIHPRYAVSISGCSHETFPKLVSATNEHKYASLLSPGNYATDHARQERENQESLVRMKPEWKEGDGELGSFTQYRTDSNRLNCVVNRKRAKRAVTVHEYKAREVEADDGMELDEDAEEYHASEDGGTDIDMSER